MDVERKRGDAFRLGVLDRRCMSARARSNELRGCGTVGDRGVEIDDCGSGSGTVGAENDIERSEAGVDSPMTGG